jgi:hypothetical protein
MIVKIDIACLAVTAIPVEHEAPSLVYPNGMISFELSFQFLEMIARRNAQVLVGHGIVEHLKLAKQTVLQIGWNSL